MGITRTLRQLVATHQIGIAKSFCYVRTRDLRRFDTDVKLKNKLLVSDTNRQYVAAFEMHSSVILKNFALYENWNYRPIINSVVDIEFKICDMQIPSFSHDFSFSTPSFNNFFSKQIHFNF